MDQEHTTGVVESPLVEPVYTTEEVGKMLKVSQRTVQDWVKTGVLTAVQYGKHLRIRPSDLATFGKVRNPRPAPDHATDGGPSPAPAGAVQE
jgi:excisionase family DNA binding protein